MGEAVRMAGRGSSAGWPGTRRHATGRVGVGRSSASAPACVPESMHRSVHLGGITSEVPVGDCTFREGRDHVYCLHCILKFLAPCSAKVWCPANIR